MDGKDNGNTVARVNLPRQGGIDQNVGAGMGWMGVAASGTTMPSVRSRFKELRSNVPAELQGRLDSVVAYYIAQYGSDATGVNCIREKSAGTYLTKLNCQFEDAWKYERYYGEYLGKDPPIGTGAESGR